MEFFKVVCGSVGIFAGWVVVGIANYVYFRNSSAPRWVEDVVMVVWLLSWPISTILFLAWRMRQREKHSKLAALERHNREKRQSAFVRARGTTS